MAWWSFPALAFSQMQPAETEDAASRYQIVVSKWDVAEIALTSERHYANPYLNVEVNSVFSHAEKGRIHVRGFWDGGKAFKVRFTPPNSGIWTFSISSIPLDPGLVRKGTVLVGNASEDHRGFLRRDDRYTRSFVFDDGTRYLMVGQTYYSIIRKAWDDPGWFESIENSTRYGFNKFRILAWPWNGKGSLPRPSPFFDNDHDRINVAYFQKLDDIVERIRSKKAIVDLILWKDHPEEAHGTIDQDFAFVEYLISRYAAYPNVIWTLANEWEYSGYGPGKEWYWEKMGQYVRAADPWFADAERLRPLSIHQQTYHSFKWSSSNWPVHAIIQVGVWNGNHQPPRFANGDEWGNYGIVQNFPLGIPVVNDEFGYFGQSAAIDGIATVIDRGHLRLAMWGIYTAGGYGSLGDATGGQSLLGRAKSFYRTVRGWREQPVLRPWLTGAWHYIPAYEDVKILVDFFTTSGISYWKMESRNDLVRSGGRVYVLADAGHEYVVYSAIGAPFQLDLPEEDWTFYWLDPSSGDRTKSGIIRGGKADPWVPPFSGDAVLHISKPRSKS
ncbi:MAG: DUF5060 domain-containing protein [Desulfobacterales bacterium]